MKRSNYCILFGTRPSIMKMSPILNIFKQNKKNIFSIHSGQHYSKNMYFNLFKENTKFKNDYYIKIPKNYRKHGEITGFMIQKIEKILIKLKPKLIFVCGDSNTNLAGAIAARKLNIKIAHVESGLRSNDWRMPEEHNRKMIDQISDILFANSQDSKKNLLKENVKGKIYVVGNTIIDTIKTFNLKISKFKQHSYNYIATFHREENVDNKNNLKDILDGLNKIGKYLQNKITIFLHPRTKKMIKRFKIKLNGYNYLNFKKPVSYIKMLYFIKHSKFLFTDSGGIQEEACFLKTKCFTLRNNTERPETIKIGSNILLGTKKIFKKFKLNKNKFSKNWNCPYGNGNTSKLIFKYLTKNI